MEHWFLARKFIYQQTFREKCMDWVFQLPFFLCVQPLSDRNHLRYAASWHCNILHKQMWKIVEGNQQWKSGSLCFWQCIIFYWSILTFTSSAGKTYGLWKAFHSWYVGEKGFLENSIIWRAHWVHLHKLALHCWKWNLFLAKVCMAYKDLWSTADGKIVKGKDLFPRGITLNSWHENSSAFWRVLNFFTSLFHLSVLPKAFYI